MGEESSDVIRMVCDVNKMLVFNVFKIRIIRHQHTLGHPLKKKKSQNSLKMMIDPDFEEEKKKKTYSP